MVSHIVLLKVRADLSTIEGQSLIDAFKQAIGNIPSVRGVRVGARVTHGAGYEAAARDRVDHLVIVDFDDLAGLQAYLRHPAHEELGVRFRQSVSSALVYDFDVGGLERLDGLV